MRVLSCALLLVALLAAGCATETTTTTTPPPSLENTAPPVLPTELKATALEPVLLGSPGGGAEPNIAVAPDGTLYASSPLAIWRSRDGGRTWQEATAKGIEGGGDGDIAVDGQGNLYWLGLFGGGGRSIPFQVSRDQGESFGKAIDLSDGTGSDREWIDVTPDGHVYTTWRGSSGLEFRASLDGGATWEKKVTSAPDANQGPVTHDARSGRLYYAAADFAAPAGVDAAALYVYASDDEGAAWARHDVYTLPRTSPAEHNPYVTDFAVAAVDANGTVYVTWSMDMGVLPATPPSVAGQYGIFVSHSTDQGGNWSAPQLVSDPAKYSRMPWMAAGAAGRVAVVWYENVHGVPGEELPDEWNAMLWESVTADRDGTGLTTKLTPAPNHIGALCTSGTGCLVSDRSLLDFFEVAIDTHGQPVTVWSSSTLGTGIGVAAKGTDVYFGGATGTPLA